ncbi:putative protein phosphatase 2C 23 [Iris pallida]|uniref:protein-serine/threonine phosphatase n=1 Tax=Iris pallida TaxID=29817 RepID=A0AAX6FJY3_IRIPA|nr:putative protein phosphatase 2C 23 [Iris pallida]
MGNGTSCFFAGGRSLRRRRRRHVSSSAVASTEPPDGHSFCYVSSSTTTTTVSSSSSLSLEESSSNSFFSISGAFVSANASTALSTSLDPSALCSSAAFESSTSFSSAPLRRSGPLDRPFLSGPLLHHRRRHNPFSSRLLLRSGLSRTLSKKIGCPKEYSSESMSLQPTADEPSLQWAQGRAGEDRVHVVVSGDDGWVFVGIYDGFNGPDATDYLLSNLYSSLALMGSCVLVMLMKGEDVYLMNVGDSRAVLGRKRRKQPRRGRDDGQDPTDETLLYLAPLQLTSDHDTSVKEEVLRIRNEHPDDSSAIANGRVKGSLKVTRSFGAGFLKQPKWNNALLEMFRIDYVGTSPYITCNPHLYHHTLGPRDKFLILSSDGLYQYFTNAEAVTEVELFIAAKPEGDPAQYLVEEVLFRAAKQAGMDFHELLEIPQGDRRRYHDDVSVVVISLEGRIWRSCV